MKKIIIILTIFINVTIYSQKIEMELDNPYIELGLWATLRVTVTGDVSNPKYKESTDLSLASIGSSSSYSIVNGRTTKSKTYLFRVIPNRKGELEIPVFYGMDSQSNKIESNKLTLYVESGSPTQQSQSSDISTEKPVNIGINIEDREFYIGEAIPIEITAFFSQNHRHSFVKSPYIKRGNFSLELEGEAIQKQDVLLNSSYWIQATWKGYLTPISTGNQELIVTMESSITSSTRSNSFFSSSRTKKVESQTSPKSLDILKLPEYNKPVGFTGAIGNFSMTSDIDMDTLSVGEPVTYKLNIYGIGNFPRVQSPVISGDHKWKVYPPSSNFTGSNGSNYSGLKSFENILSPESPGSTTLPVYRFSYFDPARKEYITLNSKEETVLVKESSNELLSMPQNSRIEYKDMGTLIKHRASGRVTSNSNYIKTRVLPIFVISLIIIIISVIINLLIKFKIIKSLKKIVRSRLDLSRLKELEDIKEYNKALLELYDLKLKEIIPDNKAYSTITSEDLKDKKSIYMLATLVESIKYSYKEVSEDEYLEIKESVIKEGV